MPLRVLNCGPIISVVTQHQMYKILEKILCIFSKIVTMEKKLDT